jgi:hypothetical protein
MKTNIILAVILYFISIITYADGDYRIMEDILLKRDYTKFDPEYEYADYIYERCYYEIFHKDFMFEKTGIRRRRLNVGDSFVYNLYYILERNDLPNLLVVVYLEQDGKVWGFYKKNPTLDGTKIYIEATKPKDYMLAFF